MLQALVVIAIVAVAVLVGQSYPIAGVMFPIKMFGYAAVEC